MYQIDTINAPSSKITLQIVPHTKYMSLMMVQQIFGWGPKVTDAVTPASERACLIVVIASSTCAPRARPRPRNEGVRVRRFMS